MTPMRINIADKLSRIEDQWAPKIIAEMDGFQIKLVKLEGDFVWHSHPETDEAFLVIEGRLRIDFRDGAVLLEQGEMLVVPKGVEHKPFAEAECQVMLLEREGTVNTGDAAENARTSDPSAKI